MSSAGARLDVAPGRPLRGRLRVPGDKSISHRSLMLNGIARGNARVRGLLDSEDVAATAAAMQWPVQGEIIREFSGGNEGIGIAASVGTAVGAAADGEVAAITRDTDQVPIMVLRHPGNLLTVYANISNIQVERGDRVARGQTIADVGPGDPSFLHFEVRQGFESVDPMQYLQ